MVSQHGTAACGVGGEPPSQSSFRDPQPEVSAGHGASFPSQAGTSSDCVAHVWHSQPTEAPSAPFLARTAKAAASEGAGGSSSRATGQATTGSSRRRADSRSAQLTRHIEARLGIGPHKPSAHDVLGREAAALQGGDAALRVEEARQRGLLPLQVSDPGTLAAASSLHRALHCACHYLPPSHPPPFPPPRTVSVEASLGVSAS